MSDTPTMLQDRIASMVHAFSDEGRKYAVRLLAADAGKLERELADAHRTIESLRADNLAAKVAGQYAIDYIDGKHRDAGRVLDGWRNAMERKVER